MRTFKFLNGETNINDALQLAIRVPYVTDLYERVYRWEVEGFELVGVTPLYWEPGYPPFKKRIYRDIITDVLVLGDIINPNHPMYSHPNTIDWTW